jgi:hypothetical protein
LPAGRRAHRLSTARSFWKLCAQPGAKATEVTPRVSPPKKADVELVLTVIVSGFPTQCAVVSTRDGDRTVPVQSELRVNTAAAKPHCPRSAAVPPITLARARRSFA